MATSGQWGYAFTNRPQYVCEVRVALAQTRVDNRTPQSRWNWSVVITNPQGLSGSQASYDLNSHMWYASIGANYWEGPYGAVDFRSGVREITIVTGTTSWFSHDSNGDLNFSAVAEIPDAGIFGYARPAGSISADRIIISPDKPSNPTISQRATTAFSVGYSLPHMRGGSQIEWRIQVATNSSFSGARTIYDSTDPKTPVRVSGLEPGTRYYVRVGVRNQAGWSAWSNTVNTTTLAAAPSKPARGMLSDPQPTSLLFTRASAPDNNGSAIIRHEVQYGTSSSFSGATVASMGTAGSIRLNNLTPLTRYYARWRSVNGEGAGAWSDSTDALTAAGIPGAPALSPLTLLSPTSLSAQWTAAVENGGAITDYRVQVATNSSFTSGLVEVSAGTDLSETLTELVTGTRYYVRVAAVNEYGQGPWSATRDLFMDQLPATPELISVTPSAFGTSATLVWQQSAPQPGSAIIRYEVQRGTQSPVSAGLSISYDALDLTPGSTYSWRVRAVNMLGPSGWSKTITATQPTVGVTAGAFFDGDTDGGTAATYSWVGAAGLSRSIASAPSVIGWRNDGDGVLYAAQAYRRVGARSAVIVVNGPGEAGQVSVGPGDPSLPGSLAEVEALAASTFSMWVRPTATIRAALQITFLDAARNVVAVADGENAAATADTWTRLSVTGESPANAEYAYLRLIDGGLSGDPDWTPWPAGTAVYMDAAMLTLGSGLLLYFDGDTADTIEYDYVWLGEPNASASWRQPTGVVVQPQDPLLDPDCGPFPTPPRPPVIDNSCTTSVDRWRRTIVRVREEEVANWAPSLPTYIIRTTQEVRQMRILVYANPDGLDPQDLGEMNVRAERVISYLPANTTLTIDVAMQRAYASVAGADPIPADHLLYGPEGGPAAWEEMACGVEYVVALDVDAALPLGAVQPVEIWMTRMAR